MTYQLLPTGDITNWFPMPILLNADNGFDRERILTFSG